MLMQERRTQLQNFSFDPPSSTPPPARIVDFFTLIFREQEKGAGEVEKKRVKEKPGKLFN